MYCTTVKVRIAHFCMSVLQFVRWIWWILSLQRRYIHWAYYLDKCSNWFTILCSQLSIAQIVRHYLMQNESSIQTEVSHWVRGLPLRLLVYWFLHTLHQDSHGLSPKLWHFIEKLKLSLPSNSWSKFPECCVQLNMYQARFTNPGSIM